VHPEDVPVEPGQTLLVVLPLGPFAAVAVNRVVGVVDEARRFAYAYGTLPGHPESGEESFSVELFPDGTVRVTVTVEAGPATLPAKLASPAVLRLQRRALARYLDAVAAHVAQTR
jgi:uncharacterized protein (UPF0548 family)